MRDDMPTPIRRKLTQQRVEFIRWCGTQVEDLIAKGIDPSPWMASVAVSLQEYVADQERPDRKAA